MFFSSLEQTLAEITNQPGWEKYQQYRQLLKCWQKIVSKEIGQQTRPLYVNRQVLMVATSSSVWAQELTLQRYSLLKQLNTQLAFSLKDIRFSPSQWQQTGDRNLSAQSNQDPHSLHPSRININPAQKSSEFRVGNSQLSFKLRNTMPPLPNQSNSELEQSNYDNLPLVDDPRLVVQRWINVLRERSSNLSVCPQCHSPTPEGELKRWFVCCHCAAKK